jgi:hypothetical protein
VGIWAPRLTLFNGGWLFEKRRLDERELVLGNVLVRDAQAFLESLLSVDEFLSLQQQNQYGRHERL